MTRPEAKRIAKEIVKMTLLATDVFDIFEDSIPEKDQDKIQREIEAIAIKMSDKPLLDIIAELHP